MKVLVACEFSGRVREAFRSRGHEAWSCDVLPSDDDSDFHIQDSISHVLTQSFQGWDLMIAHPPCTYLANSGVMHLHRDPARWEMLDYAADFFKMLWAAPIDRIAIENPIMHKYGKERIGGMKQSQVIQPWMFGHTEQKATCLWLKGLPKLEPTKNVKAEMQLLPKNQQQRHAMAEQWGSVGGEA